MRVMEPRRVHTVLTFYLGYDGPLKKHHGYVVGSTRCRFSVRHREVIKLIRITFSLVVTVAIVSSRQKD